MQNRHPSKSSWSGLAGLGRRGHLAPVINTHPLHSDQYLRLVALRSCWRFIWGPAEIEIAHQRTSPLLSRARGFQALDKSPKVQSISVPILSITGAEHLLTCTFSLRFPWRNAIRKFWRNRQKNFLETGHLKESEGIQPQKNPTSWKFCSLEKPFEG